MPEGSPNEPREVPIGSALMPWLSVPKGERKSKRWVVATLEGEGYTAWPQKQFDRAKKAARHDGAPIGGSPHVCRHTYASHFLASTPDLYLLAQVLGHSHSRVTELYAHLLPEHLARARDAVNLPVPIRGLRTTVSGHDSDTDRGGSRRKRRQKGQ